MTNKWLLDPKHYPEMALDHEELCAHASSSVQRVAINVCVLLCVNWLINKAVINSLFVPYFIRSSDGNQYLSVNLVIHLQMVFFFEDLNYIPHFFPLPWSLFYDYKH